jgi:hypothetical protein
MKIAFCFLTRANLHQSRLWENFFSKSNGRHTIYCHPKFPENVTNELLANRIIKNLVPTTYAHVSGVAASISMFLTAYADCSENEYFVLVSESTIPIVPFDSIYQGLLQANGRSIIQYYVPEPGTELYDRLQERLSMIEPPSLFSSPLYAHATWLVLHRSHVALLYDYPAIESFMKVNGADEHYFMNTLVHLKGRPTGEFVNKATTFANFREPEVNRHSARNSRRELVSIETYRPKTYEHISTADLSEAKATGAWFFRKVTEQCDCSIVEPHIGGG